MNMEADIPPVAGAHVDVSMNMEADIPPVAGAHVDAAADAAATAVAAELKEDKVILAAIQSIYEIQDDIGKTSDMQERKLLYKRRNEVIRDLPQFWLYAFMSQPPIGALLMEEDMEIFDYMDSLNVEDLDAPENGYRIVFNFWENPIFENEELVKTIRYSNQGMLSTTINWKPGFRRFGKRLSPDSTFFGLFMTPPKTEWEYEHDLVAEIIKDTLWLDPMSVIPDFAFAR